MNDSLKNDECHKLRTYILIDISSVAEFSLSEDRKVFICMISRVHGIVKELPKTIVLDSGATELFK